MLHVPRQVRIINKQASENRTLEANGTQRLQEFRDRPAWILLGEPGAGKSSAFEDEANATGGICITVSQFLAEETDHEWYGKTIFLDGLDETRSSGGNVHILHDIRSKLKKLEKPRFRISCRAADWLGKTDLQIIADVSPDGQVEELLLEPLNEADIKTILKENHRVTNAESFVEQARLHGIAELLSNPQSLALLAKAIGDGQWPSSRLETFELACKQLAAESSRQHRDILRATLAHNESILTAAGALCAVLLLSDKVGIALDEECASLRFPSLADVNLFDMGATRQAVQRKLFRYSPEGGEKIVPVHRSIAEFLAARWLATQIDSHKMPVRRALNLMLGIDGRTVAGLRGLYAWLALHSRKARPRMIAADPLTVVIYGDVKTMVTADKRAILAGLQDEAKRHAAFIRESNFEQPFGGLAHSELVPDLKAALENDDRSEAMQGFIYCVIAVITEGEPLPALASTLKKVVADDSRWSGVRSAALDAWLKFSPPKDAAKELLDAIINEKISDSDDQLAGGLLRYLYPAAIAPEKILHYFHPPKESNFFGSYVSFWQREFPEKVPEEHIPVLLDALTRIDHSRNEDSKYIYRKMIGVLITKGIILLGDHVSNDRLFSWLGIGADQFSNIDRDKQEKEKIAFWLESRPDRYLSQLELCYSKCADSKNVLACVQKHKRRLHDAAPPKRIGLWHFDQASKAQNDDLKRLHIIDALNAIIWQRGNDGLSLEYVVEWGTAHPECQSIIASQLVDEIEDWRIDHAKSITNSRKKLIELKFERSKYVANQMLAIEAGNANAGLLAELATLWLNQHHGFHGNTRLERFENYCNHGEELLRVAESGFRHCPNRPDLPSATDIIDAYIQGNEHFIRLPCLIGMTLRWQDGIENIVVLPERTIRCMLAFLLTYPGDRMPEWFTYLAIQFPAWVAEGFVEYVSKTLSSKRDPILWLYELTHDSAFREAAKIAIPRILAAFPLRTNANQLSALLSLIKAGLLICEIDTINVLKNKISIKSMDVPQKVYWLAAATLLDPKKYEDKLWKCIGTSWHRANYLCVFLKQRNGNALIEREFSALTLAKLIELLTPHAELDWPRGNGDINSAMRLGDDVRSLVTRLGNLATVDAALEIERLLAHPALSKLRFLLEKVRYQLRLKQRELAFRFPEVAEVARILANEQPANAADLAALTLDYLDDFSMEIRQGNGDIFKQFWTEGEPNAPKTENSCRDVILVKLRNCLAQHQVDCQPEADYFNDKRADIGLSFNNKFKLPIEVKCEWEKALWGGLRNQLVSQYSIDPKAYGYGIYLVLWFGSNKSKPTPLDGGKKIESPEELQTRLERLLAPEERRCIFVKVLDVSWPAPSNSKH